MTEEEQAEYDALRTRKLAIKDRWKADPDATPQVWLETLGGSFPVGKWSLLTHAELDRMERFLNSAKPLPIESELVDETESDSAMVSAATMAAMIR
jgi:hypothetical protein